MNIFSEIWINILVFSFKLLHLKMAYSIDSVTMCNPCCISVVWYIALLYPTHNEVVGGLLVSLRPSVHLSVRPSRMPCPLCIIYSYGWILFMLGTKDHYHERVCRAPWPLILTYIFKVIRPWLRKSCPLCSVYSSGWILSIFGTNDHYY